MFYFVSCFIRRDIKEEKTIRKEESVNQRMNNCETLTIVINKGLSTFFYDFFVSIILFLFLYEYICCIYKRNKSY